MCPRGGQCCPYLQRFELYPVQKFEFHRAYYRKAFHQHASGLFPAPVDLSMSSAHPPAADDEDLTPDCPQTAKFFEETTAPLISGLLSGESCTIFRLDLSAQGCYAPLL